MILRKKEDSGMALVGAILLMLVLAALAQAMFYVARNETHSGVRSRLRESAFYVADAGIEKAIYNIQNGSGENFTVNVGTRTGAGSLAGTAEVNIARDGRIYTITSTGHSPSLQESRADRRLRAVVEVAGQLPQFASMSGGSSHFASNFTITGVVFSNAPITIDSGVQFQPDKNGDVAIYCADDSAQAIQVGSNFEFDNNQPIASGVRNIWARGGVNLPNNWSYGSQEPSVKSWHDSQETGYIDDVLFVDSQAMIDDAETIMNHDFGDNTEVVDGRLIVNGGTINMNEGTYYYPNGIEINSNVEIISEGSFVAGSGSDSYDHGIEINANVFGEGGATQKNDAKVNLIVHGSSWKKEDILFNSNTKFNGIVQAPGDIQVSSNTEINGIIAAGNNLTGSANVAFNYSDDVFDCPLLDGDISGGLTFLSWTEL